MVTDQGADMNAVNSWGATPVHEAIDRGDLDVVTELLRGCPDLSVHATRGKHVGKSPLDMLQARPHMATLLDNNNGSNPGTIKCLSLCFTLCFSN